ncbi:uncharacterized protein LOC131604356 [Vicia villosa]|uniref:uncharacterized protein LOC131604356 n=1 Tax=Vicia villosa TaxID=3911 RepID=UPI00273C289B|nr:uncharacterized protein LOC131604356 [Vicia villosa]
MGAWYEELLEAIMFRFVAGVFVLRLELEVDIGFTGGNVLELRGQKLEDRILIIAEQEEADEFIIGLPKSSDGNETTQSNIVRSVAGRLAVRAAERGWRVYLHDEHGTTADAIDRMVNMGLSKSTKQKKLDAYAATMLLERYFSTSGKKAGLVLPKNLELQEKLRKGPPEDEDFFFDED